MTYLKMAFITGTSSSL